MKRYIYVIGAMATLALASCQKEELGADFNSDPSAVHINATVGSSIFGRSNPVGDIEAQKVFNNGDKIGVSAESQTAVVYAFDGTTWTPETGKYLKWDADAMKFTAYYPVTTGTDAQNFTLPTDQNEIAKIAEADYMVATPISKNKADGNVSLELQRKTARVIVHIEGYNDQYKTGYSVSAAGVSGNTNGYTAGAVTIGTITVSAYKATDFYALLTPTSADGGTTFLALTVTNGTVTDNLTVKGIPALEAGKSYTYNVTVGKDGITIGNVTVKDWGEETTIPGGEATQPFSDAKFAAVLIANHGITAAANGLINPTDPTTLQKLEAITTLNVSNKGITSLKGIEYMTGLKKLTCNYNQLTALDVSKNVALTELFCNYNQLTALDVSQNVVLTELNCNNNQLTALDVSKNVDLTYLDCGSNPLTALDISKNTALTELSCNGNQLTALDVSQNTVLETLYCYTNKLAALDVSTNTKLTTLLCGVQTGFTLQLTLLSSQQTMWEGWSSDRDNQNVTPTYLNKTEQ